jgi:chromosome segregation protein
LIFAFPVYLKRLEIQGFKSFANKTALDFLPECGIAEGAKCGITAIVGPNGSGKSNVADAIRWAIGEQSSKNLRGKRGEDVIFAGTEKKARLGSAQVTLYFDNSDKRIPIEFAEVSVTRKLYRSGESEYQINGSRVRLLDIVDLLAKAGIGKDSYSVITQGMSDALLNASPAERRQVFEDAAGVKPYQLEKDRAVRKLRSTEENLGKVGGLLLELEPHLKNLKRQAERASQSKELAARLESKQHALYHFLWTSFETERNREASERERLERELFELEVAVNTLRDEVKEVSAVLENQAREEELLKTLASLRADENRLAREESVLLGKIELERARQKEEEVVRVLPVDLAYVKQALSEIRREQEALIARLEAIHKPEDLGALREAARGIRSRLDELMQKAGEGSVKETKVIRLPDAELAESEKRIASFESERARLAEHRSAVEGSIKATESEIAESRTSGKRERERFFEKEAALRAKEAELSARKDQVNELRVRLARVEVREEDLTKLIREELGITPQALRSEGEPVTEATREKIEREIRRLKVEVEHAGGIDPLVVSEYEETRERFEFLTRESADLRAAMASLETVISEMDQKIEVAFAEAFRAIKEKFSAYFQVIFGGGRAELTLVREPKRRRGGEEEGEEEAEEAETGIEMAACPPGKKITNLSMLSGGERSLTSLALLFAIIAYNPPPFAVLDEVEAALDEANSRRFSKMLRELSGETQFVAITHNRATMAEAGLLYGVTMGQDGVSQLLSLRLDEAERAAEKEA